MYMDAKGSRRKATFVHDYIIVFQFGIINV